MPKRSLTQSPRNTSTPNRTLREMYGKSHELNEELDIMRHFSEACREDLRGRGSI